MMHCNFIDNDNAGVHLSRYRFQANPISWLSRMLSSVDLQRYTKPSDPLKKLPDTKLVQRETTVACNPLDDKQIKLLEAIAFLNINPVKDNQLTDDTTVQDNLIELITKESQMQGIDPAKITESQFKQLFRKVMMDLNERGINIGTKILEKGPLYKRCLTQHKKIFPKYCKSYEEICACDKVMDEYITTCKKTSGDYWLYRYDYSETGGKLIRNAEKGKMPFRRDYVNKGDSVYGYGLYASPSKTRWDSFRKPGGCLLKIKIKEGTPILPHTEDMPDEVKNELAQKLYQENKHLFKDVSEAKDALKKHQHKYLKQPVMVELCGHQVIIIKQPDIIEAVEMYENNHPTKMEAISHYSSYSGTHLRIGEKLNLQIKGKPIGFKEVTIPNNARLEETDKIAFGHDVSDMLPVFRYMDDAGQECFVARKNQDMTMTRQLARKVPGLGYLLLPPTYYQTKKISDCPDYRMMEPADDFLRSHYQEKLKGPEGIAHMEEKAEEKTHQLWKQFTRKSYVSGEDLPDGQCKAAPEL